MALNLGTLFSAFRQFQLVYVSLRLGIPGHLADGPKTLDELVIATGVPAIRLVRLVRGLLWAEVLTASPHGFGLTEEAKKLIDTSPGSMADEILFQGRFFYSAWGHLYDFVSSGDRPFEKAHGLSVFDLIANSAELSTQFNRPMSARTAEYSAAVVALPVFADCRAVVDVGGGEGRLAVDILAAHPAMRGVVFDLPIVRADAEELIKGKLMAARCDFVAGDMFVEVPGGGDVYLLKWILHDWNDTKALQILNNVRASMNPNARLVVMERAMPEAVEHGIGLAQADLNMLCLNGGAERTEREIVALLKRAGFILQNSVKLESYYGFHAFTCLPFEDIQR